MVDEAKIVSAAVGVAILAGLLLYRWLRGSKKESTNQVLFFPERADRKDFAILKETLKSAKQSLDVCMFTFSCQDLAQILTNAHQRGVIVRVITDTEQVHSSGSQVEWLRREGIQVRNDNTSYFMHHKFALIDNCCLVNGSLNWTVQGVFGNQENVIIVRTPQLVQPFVEQFQRLWDLYDPLPKQSVATPVGSRV